MDEARKLLETSTLKAVEISAKTGFSRSNHFFRTFRKFVGTSPKIYRKRLKAKPRKPAVRLRK
jgi:two-component system response regulator YesN